MTAISAWEVIIVCGINTDETINDDDILFPENIGIDINILK